MKPSEIKETVKASYEVKRPTMTWGDPGCAKSSAHKQAADEMKVDFIDLRMSLLEPIDMRGFPMVDPKSGQMKFAQPVFLPTKGKGILMLDEIVQAAPSMQAAASQLILDRRIGEYTLPDGWHVCAAGNLKSNRASVNAMPTHIANRFVHLYMEVSLDEWVAWALKAGIDLRVIAFLKWRTGLLHKFDPQAKGEAFPSPRSWEFVSDLLKSPLGSKPALQSPVIAGTVGEGAASEFVGFLRVFDKLPNIDAIITNPSAAAIPSDTAVLYAVTTTLVGRMTKDNIARITKFFERLKDGGHPEFAALALKAIAAEKPELQNTRAYIQFASDMSGLIA